MPALRWGIIGRGHSLAGNANTDSAAIAEYETLVATIGMHATWEAICQLIDCSGHDATNGMTSSGARNDASIIPQSLSGMLGRILSSASPADMVSAIGNLYEYGLAYADTAAKKALGQYYTPADVARLMGRNLMRVMTGRLDDDGPIDANHLSEAVASSVIVEPSCGCGSLLVPALAEIGTVIGDAALADLIAHRLVLCDLDDTALSVCSSVLGRAFGVSPCQGNVMRGDFLADDACERIDAMGMPSYVIINPPYGKPDPNMYAGMMTRGCNDLYALFIERCVGMSSHAGMSAIVPQSFLSAAKFSPLRELLAGRCDGAVLPYDNVPSPVFCGRKHGITNTNATNSVRAAIVATLPAKSDATVTTGDDHGAGRRRGISVAPMLRFHADEREKAIGDDAMSLAYRGRVVGMREAGTSFPKVPLPIAGCYDWLRTLPTIGDVATAVSADAADDGMTLWVPATPRYRTSASTRRLDRSSMIVLRFSDEGSMRLAYLTLNSSIAYAWWRMHDGGITLTRTLCMSIPLVPSPSDDAVAEAFGRLARLEPSSVHVKMNAGKRNESLDFGQDAIDGNTRLLLGGRYGEDVLDAFAAMHSPYVTRQLAAFG